MAWLAGWDNRIKLTLDKDQVDAALSNFPVMVYLSAASGIGNVDVSCVFDELTQDANRKKIAVTSSDGTTELYVEIERWDDGNEVAWLHIKVPSVSDTVDEILYLYYDADHADNDTYVGDTTDAVTHNIWDANFVGVWHMAQDPNGDGADAIKDSTSNANEGTPQGTMTTADLVNAKVGKGIDFDAVDDAIQIADSNELDLGTGDFTLEAIVKTSDQASRIFYKGYHAYAEGYYRLYFRNADPYVRVTVDNNSVTVQSDDEPTDYADGVEHHIVGQRDGDLLRIFADGTEKGTAIAGANTIDVTNDDPLFFSTDITGGVFHVKVLDEMRISNIARSAAWIKATYHSLWDSLITFGAEEDRVLTLTVAGSDQLQTVDSLVILRNPLTVQGADQLQTVDAIALTQKHTLAIQGADQLQVIDVIALSQKHTLAIQGADHLQVAENVGSLFILVMAACNHLQTVDNISVNLHIIPASADQLQITDAIALTQKHLLVTQDVVHLHTVESPFLEWPGWLTLYGKKATKYYYLTLTGSADSLADLTIPMSSFRARRRNGEPSFFSAITPGRTLLAGIKARLNGELILTTKYVVPEQEDRWAEIMRVDMETWREYQGGRNQSAAVEGHATEDFPVKTVTLLDPTYKLDDYGNITVRCATVDPFLKPGDTAVWGEISFVVEQVSFFVSIEDDAVTQSMEAQEVEA